MEKLNDEVLEEVAGGMTANLAVIEMPLCEFCHRFYGRLRVLFHFENLLYYQNQK